MVVEREEYDHALKVQHPMYFVSNVLSSSKIRYPHVWKLTDAVLIAKRKLLHYFESHHIKMVTSSTSSEII